MGTSSYTRYLELCGVPQIILEICGVPRVTLELCGVPQIMRGTSNYTGVIHDTSNYAGTSSCAGVIRYISNYAKYLELHWNYSVNWHVAFYNLFCFQTNPTKIKLPRRNKKVILEKASCPPKSHIQSIFFIFYVILFYFLQSI